MDGQQNNRRWDEFLQHARVLFLNREDNLLFSELEAYEPRLRSLALTQMRANGREVFLPGHKRRSGSRLKDRVLGLPYKYQVAFGRHDPHFIKDRFGHRLPSKLHIFTPDDRAIVWGNQFRKQVINSLAPHDGSLN